MLSVRDVTIQFEQNVLLRNVNCDFRPGAISGIKKTGMLDGSTSFMKCCAGVLTPTQGRVLWKQQCLSALSDMERFRTFCYCYEWGGLISLFSIYNNIAIPLAYHQIFPVDEIQSRVNRVAEQLGIESLLELEPFQLNDVQIRLVNLARALVIEADVILVDEIQTGMPHKMVQSLADILLEQADKGVTLILVTTSGDDHSFIHDHYIIQNRSLERVK